MKGSARQRNQFAKAIDGRGQPVRGLWMRNGRFYARMSVPHPDTGVPEVRRVPLEASTVAQARQEMERLRVERSDNRLPALRRSPTLAEYSTTFLERMDVSGRKPATLTRLRRELKCWVAMVGHLRLTAIRPAHVNGVLDAEARRVSAASVNLRLSTLRVLLKTAVADGWLRPPLACDGVEKRRGSPPKRKRLLSAEEVDALAEAATTARANGPQCADYIRFLAYSGARCAEALALSWSDVDFDRRVVVIGAEPDDTKSRRTRTVDFNAELERHLLDMRGRRAPDTEWLFPSSRRGRGACHENSLRGTFDLARAAVGAEDASFHHLRHFFISRCVMSGIDFATCAKWVGHADGGALLARVYSHLADEHRRRMADRLVFRPQPVAEAL